MVLEFFWSKERIDSISVWLLELRIDDQAPMSKKVIALDPGIHPDIYDWILVWWWDVSCRQMRYSQNLSTCPCAGPLTIKMDSASHKISKSMANEKGWCKNNWKDSSNRSKFPPKIGWLSLHQLFGHSSFKICTQQDDSPRSTKV